MFFRKRRSPFSQQRGPRDFDGFSPDGSFNDWQGRNDPAVYPRFKIRFETEHHVGYINLQLKPESQNPTRIQKFCEEFFQQTGNRIILIERYDQNQEQVIEVYRSPLEPAPDLNLGIHIKYEINNRDKVSIIVNSKAYDKAKTFAILKEHFWDSTGRPIRALGSDETSSNAVNGWQLKTRQHKAYSQSQKASIGSPIENQFEEALKKAGLVYRKQVKVHIEGEIFTIPDFVIDDPRIAIYCDGSEFHSDTQRIMKDKQQDRILQSKGYIVLRFSGSEIYHDAGKCVREVVQFVRTGKL